MGKSTGSTSQLHRKTGAQNRGQKKGLGALRAGSAVKTSKASGIAGRTAPNGETNTKTFNYRSEGTIRRLNMYKKAPARPEKRQEQSLKPMRIQPDRRWFGNTRVIAQDKMQAFRETLSKKVDDPFSVVLRSSKLPMSLLQDTDGKASKMDLLQVEPFKEAFGKKRRQKRPKLTNYDLDGLLKRADDGAEDYDGKEDKKSLTDKKGEPLQDDGMKHGVTDAEIFLKGTSKRIWAELYKVVDSSDVIVFVLDARDPQGTRCLQLEQEIKKNRSGKHVLFLINKVDLVPTWATRRWVQELTKERPTLAFHASITNPFGKSALINLLRQFSTLLKERKHVTVGFVGYPNVGKSAVINTMRRKKVVNSAPVPGETKCWQYVALSKKLYLLDCPGVVPGTASDFKSDCAKVLKGVVRAERVKTPSDYIDEVISRVKRQYLIQRYKLPADTRWEDGEEFLNIIGKKMGKLIKGGDVDLNVTARIVLYDWQRGRIPYFTAPADGKGKDDDDAAASKAEKTAEKADGEDGEEAKEGEEQIVVHQDFTELACSMKYDAEDRQGEDAPSGDDDSDADAPAGAAGLAAASRKRGRPSVDGKNKQSNLKKKARRGKGGGQGASSSGGPAGGTASNLKPGVVDWSAVASEFKM